MRYLLPAARPEAELAVDAEQDRRAGRDRIGDVAGDLLGHELSDLRVPAAAEHDHEHSRTPGSERAHTRRLRRGGRTIVVGATSKEQNASSGDTPVLRPGRATRAAAAWRVAR